LVLKVSKLKETNKLKQQQITLTLALLMVIVVAMPLLASDSNPWEELRPSASLGAEITSSTMLVAPVAVGLQWNNIFGFMFSMSLYADEKIPVVVRTSIAYSPSWYWEMSLGLSPRIYLTKKSFGSPLKRIYITPFLGATVYPKLKTSVCFSLGVDFR